MEGWSAAKPMPESWVGPSFGYDGSGRATVGYVQIISMSPVSTRVAIADGGAAGVWADAVEFLSSAGDLPSQITIAVGPDGAAAACVTSASAASATATLRHFVLYRPAGGTQWENPVDIVPRSEFGSIIQRVVMAPNGIATVLANRFDGPPDHRIGAIVVSSHAPGGAWTPPQQVNPPGIHVDIADLAVDAAGNATIAWMHRWQSAPTELHSIRVVTRPAATGVLGPAAILTAESGAADASGVRVAVNASGAAVLGTQVNTQANLTTRDTQLGSWKPMTALFTSATAASSAARALAISRTGTCYVLYWQQGAVLASDSVIGMSRNVSGTWEAPTDVSERNMEMFDGTVVFRADDAFPVYTGAIGFGGGSPGIGILQAGRWRPNAAAPEPPIDIAPRGATHFLDQVAWDNAGSVVVIEHVIGAAAQRTFATTFDRVLTSRFRFQLPGPVTAVTFSPDGTLLAAAGDKVARVFDLSTGQKRFDVTHGARVNAVVFTPDGLAIATASDDATARVTSIATGAQLTVVTHDTAVTVLAVSRDGHRLASGGADGFARLADIGSATPARRLPLDGAVTGLAFDPSGGTLAVSCDDGTARVFSTETGSLLLNLAHGGAVTAVAFNGDGTRLATASADKTAHLFNVSSGANLFTFTHGGPVNTLTFDATGTRLATASDDGTCRIFNAQDGTGQQTLGHPAAVTAVAFGRLDRIATATAEQIVYAYRTAEQQGRLRHDCPVHGIAFRPDGTLLATAGEDKIVRVYELPT